MKDFLTCYISTTVNVQLEVVELFLAASGMMTASYFLFPTNSLDSKHPENIP